MKTPCCSECLAPIHDDEGGTWDTEIGWLCAWCKRAALSEPADDRTYDDSLGGD